MSRAIANDELRARLLKVLRLARQGVGGEKENAETLLTRMLRRHGLTVADLHELEGEPRDLMWLPVADDLEATVLQGLVRALFGRDRETWATAKSRKKLGINVTKAEAVSIEIAWEVYAKAWEEEQHVLCLAFLTKHRLFDSSPRDEGEQAELSEEELARAHRARAMIDVLERVERPGRRIGRSGS